MPMAERFSVVLFDLDGTLIDAVEDLADAINAALVQMNHEPRSCEQIGGWLGNGLSILLHRALTGDMDGLADDAVHADVTTRFRRAYIGSGHAKTRVLPGATELLQELRLRKVFTAIVTNKPQDTTESVMASIGEALPVDAVFGAEHDWPRKPEPGMLHAATQAGGGGAAVMIGDSVTDRDAAANASMPFVAVRGGYNHGGDIADMVPAGTPVFDNLHGVGQWLEARV
jgi:phosphoglycolate phosphatase